MESARHGLPPAALAKGALRRLAQAQLEPTPENYARAYAEESGQPAPSASAVAAVAATAPGSDSRAQGAVWAALVERLARNLERRGRQWTAARRKDSLHRVLDGSRSDGQRLQALMGAWESDQASNPEETGITDPPVEVPVESFTEGSGSWPPLVAALEGSVRAGLPPEHARAAELARQLATLADTVAHEGANPTVVADIEAVCEQARRLFAHPHRLVDELGALCRELGAGLTELAEDDSWARGQCQSLQARLADGSSVRGVRAAAALLAETRWRHQQVRAERQAARDALKHLIHDMIVEVGELGEHAGRFQLATAQHVQAIERAESLQGLAEVVKTLLENTRSVQSAVHQSQDKLHADRARAAGLENKVRSLEAELRRLSEEVSPDALSQVANRRGLGQAFEAESARCLRATGAAAQLAVGLIDIDNFKKLNDTLGHAAGDQALRLLAGAVRERLRPADHVARFGGEEFVVLLPGSEIDEAQQALTRLQRGLTEALFLHEGREVFVTFRRVSRRGRPGSRCSPPSNAPTRRSTKPSARARTAPAWRSAAAQTPLVTRAPQGRPRLSRNIVDRPYRPVRRRTANARTADSQ